VQRRKKLHWGGSSEGGTVVKSASLTGYEGMNVHCGIDQHISIQEKDHFMKKVLPNFFFLSSATFLADVSKRLRNGK
jgi:hypothetical protein